MGDKIRANLYFKRKQANTRKMDRLQAYVMKGGAGTSSMCLNLETGKEKLNQRNQTKARSMI